MKQTLTKFCVFVHFLCRKLKKSSNDVTEGLSALSLEESSGVTQSQKLSTLEKIFSFTSSHPTQFPQTHCQQFTEQLKDLPAGNTLSCLYNIFVPSSFPSKDVICYTLISSTEMTQICYCYHRNNRVHALSRGGVSRRDWQHYTSDQTAARLRPSYSENPYYRQRGIHVFCLLTILQHNINIK